MGGRLGGHASLVERLWVLPAVVFVSSIQSLHGPVGGELLASDVPLAFAPFDVGRPFAVGAR